MVKFMLCGCQGKMGHVIEECSLTRGDCQVVAGVDLDTDTKRDFPVFKSPLECTEAVDAVIDFSHPSTLDAFAGEWFNPGVFRWSLLPWLQRYPDQPVSMKLLNRFLSFLPLYVIRSQSAGRIGPKGLLPFWADSSILKLWRSIITERWMLPVERL